MTQTELATRAQRARSEPLVLKETEEGFLVYSAATPSKSYVVSGAPDNPVCTCPDFQVHEADPDWRCKHILAVLRRFDFPGPGAEVAEAVPEESGHAPATLLIKRSVSPDRRIDSLSVEFTAPVAGVTEETIHEKAGAMLQLQDEIVALFLDGRASEPPAPTGNGGAIPARLVDVQVMETRKGRRMYINVDYEGGNSLYFGTREQLAAAVRAAGYPDEARRIAENVMLDLPCRVVTKPSADGRYVNIDKVLPADGVRSNGGPARARKSVA